EFNRSAKINQYTDEYKLRVVSGYLQGAAGQWFSETQGERNPILHWNEREQMKVQKLGETVEQYANDVKKLIKRIDGENRWSNDEKVWHFLKGLRKDIAYQARPLILSRENSTLESAVRIAKQFEENVQTFPEAAGYGVSSFANIPFTPVHNKTGDKEEAMERVSDKPANTFHGRPNYFLDDRERNMRNRSSNVSNSPRCYACGQTGHMAQGCSTRIDYQRNATDFWEQEQNKPERPQVDAATRQTPLQTFQSGGTGKTDVAAGGDVEIKGVQGNSEGTLTEEKEESASSPTTIHRQLMGLPLYHNEVRKALVPRRAKVTKTANHTKVEGNTPMICKAQVAGWKVDIILDSGSSISIISENFMKSLGRKINKSSDKKIISIHGERRSSMGVVTQVQVKLGSVTVATDMEVISATGYALVLGTNWLRKANTIINYQECKLTLKNDENTVEIPCRNTNTIILENDDDTDSGKMDTEEDEEKANFVGLTYNLPRQEVNVTLEGIRTNLEYITWEIYDYLTYCLDVIRRKRHKQEQRKAAGLNTYCWCDKYLKTKEDKCKECGERLQSWEAVSM
ncbi:18196_t:CDS:2, partial [Dentiscutata erythropus]